MTEPTFEQAVLARLDALSGELGDLRRKIQDLSTFCAASLTLCRLRSCEYFRPARDQPGGTIEHTRRTDLKPGEAFIFADLAWTCSVCAPRTMTKAEVEDFAGRELKEQPIGGWEAIDKSKMGLGDPTPNPCNHDAQRQHWFLIGGLQAAAFGFPTRKTAA